MPQIQTRDLPPAILRHLLEQAVARQVSEEDLWEFTDWLATHPTVPEGQWFKRFTGTILCGEGVLPKTFLMPGQHPFGDEVL